MTRGPTAGLSVGITRHSDDVNPSAGMKTYLPLRERNTVTLFSTLSSWNTLASWARGVPSTWRQTAFPRLAESAVM